MKHSKACYLTASILSVVLLFLLTPIQRYFSYLASTTYSIKWAWISLAEVAVMAVFFGLSLCWSRELSRNFRIPAEAVKAALALAALGMEFFLLQSSFHSRCFLRGSFPHRFFRQSYRPAVISRKSSVLFSFLGVPFSHLMICFEAPLAAPRGLFSGGISPRARRAVVRHDR